jgi:protein-disulfide isomerase
MRTLRIVLHLALASLLLATPAVVLADPPGITYQQAEEILSELRLIRQLLQNGAGVQARAPAPAVQNPVASVAVRDSNTLGLTSAPLTLVEFADYQCPFCRQFDATAFDELKSKFVDTGKLRYVARDLPLPIHDHATEAARAARCAGDQRHYWEARRLFMSNQQKLEHTDLIGYARDLRLDVKVFKRCLNGDKYEAAVQQDAADAAAAGVIGTPTFILGRTQQNGRFTGIRIVGAQPYGVFETQIQEMLAKDASGGRAP